MIRRWTAFGQSFLDALAFPLPRACKSLHSHLHARQSARAAQVEGVDTESEYSNLQGYDGRKNCSRPANLLIIQQCLDHDAGFDEGVVVFTRSVRIVLAKELVEAATS